MDAEAYNMIGKVNEILCEHHRLGTIPSRDQGGLLTRLSLTFDPPLHVERSDVRWGRGEEHKEANRRWQGRQAFNVYSEVLDRRPDIFLAFVVARPASRCIGFNVTEFLRRYNEAYPDRNFAPLDNDARELLLHTSRKGNFSTNERFQSSPGREHEKALRWETATTTTECILGSYNSGVTLDGIVTFNVGKALDLVRILFPGATLPPPQEQTPEGWYTTDTAYFTLTGANISGLLSLFPPEICDAIEASELRAWEREHFLTETTDCVTLKVCRTRLYQGCLSVRVGGEVGLSILDRLFPG
ncbi:hypothetical protein H2204_001248 [Knufia peltigerae]|uniref:Uncharacterized protein n=1 Tax=Knufia peltigerae TaxID=1002370 RepID=A0AA38YEH4_9EURO|nr:hypothetical protein H2204_001248 [Knufia peltigerae]